MCTNRYTMLLIENQYWLTTVYSFARMTSSLGLLGKVGKPQFAKQNKAEKNAQTIPGLGGAVCIAGSNWSYQPLLVSSAQLATRWQADSCHLRDPRVKKGINLLAAGGWHGCLQYCIVHMSSDSVKKKSKYVPLFTIFFDLQKTVAWILRVSLQVKVELFLLVK